MWTSMIAVSLGAALGANLRWWLGMQYNAYLSWLPPGSYADPGSHVRMHPFCPCHCTASIDAWVQVKGREMQVSSQPAGAASAM